MGRLAKPGTRGPNPRFMPAFEHFPLRPGLTGVVFCLRARSNTDAEEPECVLTSLQMKPCP